MQSTLTKVGRSHERINKIPVNRRSAEKDTVEAGDATEWKWWADVADRAFGHAAQYEGQIALWLKCRGPEINRTQR